MSLKRLFSVVLILVVILSLFVFQKIETAMEVGAGSKAKFLCSNFFISGRTPESILTEEACNATRDIGVLGRMGDALTKCEINRDDKCATCKLLWVKRKVIYRDHLGATLLYGTVDSQIRNSETVVKSQKVADLTPLPPEQESMPWPTGDMIDMSIPPEVDPQQLQLELHKAFEESNPEHPMRTHGIVIVYDGQLIAERYAEDKGYLVNTPHYGWSMTKSVTSVLIGILVKQNKLDIYNQAPIKQWLNPNDPRHFITTDQLLRMSSGLKFNENYDSPISDVNNMLFGNWPSMVDYAASKSVECEPDTRWQYSTGTSMILGGIIQSCFDSHQKYQSFARRELFDKIGMRSAIIEYDQNGNLGTGSYMWATPRDWARFGLLCLQDGIWDGERILPVNWIKYATTPTSTDPKAHYGAQFWLNKSRKCYPALPEDLFECRGKDGQRVTVIPSRKLVVVRLGYTPNGASWDHETFVQSILRAIGT
jgi:CubicO group peptidase (beta-lactamase class C family)